VTRLVLTSLWEPAMQTIHDRLTLPLNDVEVAGKRLELLREAVPRASRVAVLWNAAHPGHNVVSAGPRALG